MTSKRRAGGFTLLELIVAMTIAGVVLTGVVRLMTGQSRGYAQQKAVGDASETLRGAGALLAWEVRHAEMAVDTVLSQSADTLSVRSVQGVGIICAKRDSGYYAIWKNGGDIAATADDTALVSVLSPNASASNNYRVWNKLKITQVGTPAAMNLAACVWPGARPPDLVVKLNVTATSDTAGINVGAMFRSFRKTKFAEYQSQGRWWLGRQVGAGSWNIVTGPLLPPASNGLKFAYYDSNGVAVVGNARVRNIGITLYSQSYTKYKGPTSGTVVDYRQDSLITRVSLRR
jgi:prepilin-type N-terminal cleavage/methylation domain-containing protein